jgi:anti-sigma regulatory factor (Ser/Thr protein kinase)
MKTDQPAESGPSTAGAFRHEALLYTGADEFVAATASFVRDAIRADESIMVAVIEHRATRLHEELGADARHVRFVDMAQIGRNPARIIPAWQEWVAENASRGRGFRGVGEPIWAGRTAAETVECEQHEQLLNTAFDGGPGWWLLCPYDTAGLSPAVIKRAHHTHPALRSSDGRVRSANYPHPELSAPAMFAMPLPEPSTPAYETGFGLDDLARVREVAVRFAASVPVSGRRTEELVLIANELACNSIRHGGGRGLLRLWQEGGEVVCEVRDDGLIVDPLVGRHRPDPQDGGVGGAGLWIVNRMCDLVQIRSTPQDGTTVRAHFAASPAA